MSGLIIQTTSMLREPTEWDLSWMINNEELHGWSADKFDNQTGKIPDEQTLSYNDEEVEHGDPSKLENVDLSDPRWEKFDDSYTRYFSFNQ